MPKEALSNLADKFGIVLIYFFGSQVETAIEFLEKRRITQTSGADLDIAIALEKPETDFEVFGKIYSALARLFEPFNIDLIFIHEVDPLFQYEIIKGKKVYEKNELLAEEYEERVMKLAADLKFKKKIFDREVMESIEHGYFEFEYNPNP